MGHEADNPAAAVRNGSLAQCHWQASQLSALFTENDITNRTDFHLCARLAVLPKLQQTVLDGQCTVSIVLCVFESQQMSCANAEFCISIRSVERTLRRDSDRAEDQRSEEPQHSFTKLVTMSVVSGMNHCFSYSGIAFQARHQIVCFR